MSNLPVPIAIHRTDEAITITWEEGHVGVYPARDLRLACPCAVCKEEMTGRALLDPATLPEDIAPLKVELVGAYAIKIVWSDGHDTGIYTYEHLLSMCPCGCRGDA
jgi:ATP-binding protein involved in chromosome partitioning